MYYISHVTSLLPGVGWEAERVWEPEGVWKNMGHGGSTHELSVTVVVCLRPVQDCATCCQHSLMGVCGFHEAPPHLKQLMVLG